jgi:predicted DsbA family dithiol-disulfide isomerase
VTAAVSTAAIALDVWSDVVCPFCFIGRRRLDRALAEEPPGSVDVRWRAFQLNPDVPPEGVDEVAYLAQRFGSEADVRAAHERVRAMGADVGIEFKRFDVPGRRIPNTLLAHRAIKLAERDGAADAAVEACFAAHFEDALDLGDPDVVAQVTGVDRALLDTDVAVAEVQADLRGAAERGIHGVPCFVAEDRIAVSGAHDTSVLRRLFAAAREQKQQP